MKVAHHPRSNTQQSLSMTATDTIEQREPTSSYLVNNMMWLLQELWIKHRICRQNGQRGQEHTNRKWALVVSEDEWDYLITVPFISQMDIFNLQLSVVNNFGKKGGIKFGRSSF